LEEQMLYGSSRLGSVKLHEKLVEPSSGTVIDTQKRGQKRYLMEVSIEMKRK